MQPVDLSRREPPRTTANSNRWTRSSRFFLSRYPELRGCTVQGSLKTEIRIRRGARSRCLLISKLLPLANSPCTTMADAADLPGASSSQKMSSKLLRQRAQEFLASRKHANNLVDIIAQWDVSGISEMNFKHTGYATRDSRASRGYVVY